MTFEITEATWEDVASAIRFYDSKPDRHGANVRAEFGRAAAAIADSPRMYPLVADEYPGTEVREYLITRFDQRVLYMIEGERIQVIAFIHASRRPKSWHYRLTSGN